MKKWLKISLISLGSLIGFFVIVFSMVCYILFTPSRLTPLVNRFANDFLNAEVYIGKVDLAYVSVYPFVRLNIDNILILEQQSHDTLTFIPTAKAKLNFNQFIFQNNLILSQLELRGGITNVHFDKNGTMNWDIFPASDTTANDTTSTALDSLFNKIDVQQIIINSGQVNYRNEQSGQIAVVRNANLNMNGSFIEQNLLSEMALDLKHVVFSDSTMNVEMGGFRTKLKGNLLNSQVNAISDIVVDSLDFRDQSMAMFVPNMTLNLESETNFKDGKIRMNSVVEQIHFDYEKENLLKNTDLKLILSAEYFSENEKISIEKGKFSINEINFELAGNIEVKGDSYYPNLTFDLEQTRFAQIYELLPKSYKNMLLEYAEINDGEIFCKGVVTGVYSNKSMPNIDMTLGLKNMDMVVSNSKIDTLNLLSDVKLRMNNLQNSILTVRDFYYSGHLGRASAKAVVKGFSDNPHIDIALNTNLDLRRLYVLLMGRRTGYRTQGNIHANLNADFTLKDAMDVNLEKIKVDGIVEIDSLLVRNRADSLNLWIDFARLRFGASVDDTTLTQGLALFRANMRMDSLDFAYKNLYTANIGRFTGGYRVEMPNTNNVVNTQTARISFRGLNVRMPQERMRVSAGRTSANVRIIPNPEKPTSPVGTIRMSLDSLNFRQDRTVVRLNQSQLNFALSPQIPMVRESRDTTQNQGERRRGRDTTVSQEERRLQQLARLKDMSSDDFLAHLMSYLDILRDTTVDIAQKFMNEFSYEGSLEFDTFRMRIPEFPLPIQVLTTEVHLTPRVLSLDNAQVIMGNTDMTATGSIENFRRALAGRGTLQGNLDIKSQKIDGNQLMYAMSYDRTADTARGRRGEGRGNGGGRRNIEPEVDRFTQMDQARRTERAINGEQTNRPQRWTRANTTENIQDEDIDDTPFISVEDSVVVAENKEDDSMFEIAFETPPEATLFMIPQNLALTLNVKIDTLTFKGGVMTDLQGQVEVRDEHLLLNQFRLVNGSGEMNLDMAYRARSLQDGNLWLDLSLEKTDIQNLLELYPDIADSIMPIAHSFQGLIDLKLTASAELDSAMNVDLNRTSATANFDGINLVLLDGETFTKISRPLMFRNKNRNLIDSLSVDLVVHHGAIEVFPFRLAMDRYVFAVGGTQDLDMNFQYHITVLKSPMPFKLGIDIFGNTDRFRYRMVRPKFRRMDSPAVSIELENRTVSVQGEIRRLLEHEFKQIVGQTED
ncbi:MAG: AsmA family protein [Bacteroidales bacterium]|nr:AsmA family protein [Bacteroidales bacterium]